MVLAKLEKLIRARYNKFTLLTGLSFVFILAGVFFTLNYYYNFILSLVLGIVTIGIGVFFGFSLKKMIHYHGKLMEVWDERIKEAKDLKEAATANGLILGSNK